MAGSSDDVDVTCMGSRYNLEASMDLAKRQEQKDALFEEGVKELQRSKSMSIIPFEEQKSVVERQRVQTVAQKKGPSRKGSKVSECKTEGEGHMVVKRTRKGNAAGPPFTRMSPNGLYEFIQSMSDEQRKDVEDIGFGNLLYLQTYEMPTSLLIWLVSHFNPYKMCIEFSGQELKISEHDIYCTLGLPKGEKQVIEGPLKPTNETQDYKTVLEDWKKQFSGTISKTDVLNKMEEEKKGGIWFKRNFIVYVVSSLIKGHTNVKPNHRILKSLVDVEEIRNLKWCAYTRESLYESTIEWQKCKSMEKSPYKGPALLLLLCYLDRVSFGPRKLKREFPVLKSWTRERIFQRFDDEKKEGSFGLGTVEESLQNTGVEEDPMDIPDDIVDEPKDPTKEVAHDLHEGDFKDKKACIQRVADAAKNLAVHFANFVDAIEDARSRFPNWDVVQKMDFFASSMANLYVDVDSSDVCLGKRQRVNEGKSNVDSLMQEYDDLFADPKLWEAVDALEKNFQKKRKTPADFTPPSFDLKVSQERHCSTGKTPTNLEADVEAPNTIVYHRKKKNVVSPTSPSLVASPTCQTLKTPTEHVVTNPIVEPITAPIIECVEEIKKPPKRLKKPTFVCKSPFMIRNVGLLKDLTLMEKMVADYAFYRSDGDQRIVSKECMYKDDKDVLLSRLEVRSLSSNNQISPMVVDFWVYYLNKREEMRDDETPARLFLSLGAGHLFSGQLRLSDEERYSTFENIMNLEIQDSGCIKLPDVKLIFFPIGAPEQPEKKPRKFYFYVICFNFINSTVEIIDHQEGSKRNYAKIAKNLEKHLSRYLEQVDMPQAKILPNFKHQLLKMPWRSKKEFFADSGIYAMRHMETYFGNLNNWDVGFKIVDEKYANKMRVKYCHRILTWELNLLKEDVEMSAKEFASREHPIRQQAQGD